MTEVVTPPSSAPEAPSDGSAWTRVGIALLTVALIVPPFVTNSIELTKLSRLIVLVLAVLGVNVLTGYTGLISLGHGVFVGVGAFTVANLIDQGMSLFIAGFLATLFTGVIGLLLGLPALRVRGLYLALVTFGFALAFPPVARNRWFSEWTGGVTGRTVTNEAFAPPSFLGIDDHIHIWRYLWCLVIVAVWFLIVRNLVNSRMGRAIRTLRDNEPAAATFGVNIRYAKAGALAISAAMTGTAGVLQALLNPYIAHSDFNAILSLRLYAAAVIGGLGTMTGAIYGVLALIVVPAVNGALDLLQSDAVVFGAGLVIMTYIAPTGIAGLVSARRNKANGEV